MSKWAEWFWKVWFAWLKRLISLDIPNLTLDNINYENSPFEYTVDLQATSTFLLLEDYHTIDADELAKYIKGKSKYLQKE